jgi:magnesium-transporting ATPase (P-type)
MIPALALGAEKPEQGTLKLPPRPPSKPLLDRTLLARAYGFLGLMEAVLGMSAFLAVWGSYGINFTELQAVSSGILAHTADPSTRAIYQQATTATLATIVACQDGNVFACRSEQTSIFQLGFFSNRLILWGILTEWVLILCIIFLRPLENLFATAPLEIWQWLLLLICPPILLGAEELRKRIFRRQQS